MDRHRSSLIIVIVVFFVMFMLFMCLFVDRMAGESQIRRQEDRFEAQVSKSESYEFCIYWIGDVPEGLERIGDKLAVVAPGDVSEDTMPIPWGDMHFTRYNEDGVPLEEIEPRDYAPHMLIVVNNGSELTEDQYEILRQCTVDNEVPVLLLGDSIAPFREMMLLYVDTYSEDDSMLFVSASGAEDGVINIDGARTDKALACEVLKLICDLIDRGVA